MLESEKNQGGRQTKKRKGSFSILSKQMCELLQRGQSGGLRGKETENHASKKWGALIQHSGRWLLFEQHLVVPKHVMLSQKMRLAWLVSIPAPCFFDQQAVHDKNSKGDICGFPNWDWKISKESLSISEHCKKTPHHTKWACCLEPFSSFLHIWSCWHQVSYFHACRGQILHISINNLKQGHTKKKTDFF